MDKILGIYKWINKINNHYYVGSSSNIESRKYYHLYLLTRNKHENSHLQRAWNKYKEYNFEFVIIENITEIERLLQIEQKYLDIAKSEKNKCYNKSFIAGRVEFTNEVRKKISESQTKRLRKYNPLRGRKLSEETKHKISMSRIGKYKGVNSPLFGKPKSKSHRINLSKSRSGKFKGVNNGNSDKRIYKIQNVKTGELFEGNYYDFQLKHQVYTRIADVLKGKCKHLGRYWKILTIDSIIA